MASTTIRPADVADVLANIKAMGQDTIAVDGKGTRLEIDLDATPEIQTDKEAIKIVPCRECKRPLGVTTFFAPAKAICRSCSGEALAEGGGVATVGQPTPGQTDPARAINLADCLVNKPFAQALCPVHPDDPDHVMEIKTVSHSQHYGPGHYEKSSKGLVWVQDAPGETVRHQCTKCLATVDYATTQRSPLHRQNAPKTQPDTGIPERNHWHGIDALPPELVARIVRYLPQSEVHALLEVSSSDQAAA